MEMVSELEPPAVVSNTDIIMAQFPTCRQEAECIFILGNYIELVDSEAVSKQKELLPDTLVGVIKSRLVLMRSRAVPQVQIVL